MTALPTASTALPAHNPPIDIEELMARIRAEVAQRRKTTPTKAAFGPGHGYTMGMRLDFGAKGNARAYIGSGWSQPEPAFCWTDGEVAEILLAFERPPSGDLVLSFKAHPMIGGPVEAQEVSVTWNGSPVGEWTIRESRTCHTVVFAPVAGESAQTVLRFSLPKAFSPASMNLAADRRRLGLAFAELTLQPAADFGFQSL